MRLKEVVFSPIFLKSGGYFTIKYKLTIVAIRNYYINNQTVVYNRLFIKCSAIRQRWALALFCAIALTVS